MVLGGNLWRFTVMGSGCMNLPWNFTLCSSWLGSSVVVVLGLGVGLEQPKSDVIVILADAHVVFRDNLHRIRDDRRIFRFSGGGFRVHLKDDVTPP